MSNRQRDQYYTANEQVYYKGKVHTVLDWAGCFYLRCPYTSIDVYIGQFKHRPVYAISGHVDENGVIIPVAQRELRKVYHVASSAISNITNIFDGGA